MVEKDVSRIAQQIENTADYYPPGTYSGAGSAFETVPISYLTYYNQIVLNSDYLAEQYIPISTVPQRGRNPKIFAIGVIPPSANITGRIIDRTASAQNLLGISEDLLANIPTIASDNSAGLAGASLPIEFWVEYVQMCGRLKCNPVELGAVLQAESNFDPKAVNFQNGHPVAKGLNQIIEKNSSVVGLGPGEWSTFEDKSAREQLPYVESYFSKCGVQGKDRTGIYATNFGGYSNPNGSRYASLAFINGYQPEGDRAKFKNPTHQDSCYHQNYGLDKDGKGYIVTADLKTNAGNGPSPAIKQKIAEAQAFIQSGKSLPVPSDGTPGDFKNKGSRQAADARDIQDKTANTPLTAQDIAAQYTAAQYTQIKLIQKTLEAMQNTPPLRLMVNPQSFSVKGEKIVSDSGWSRNGGTIVEHWGNAQEKISASGKVAGFYAIDVMNGVAPGLTRMARNASQSWQNFQSLQLFYANNAGIYTLDATSATLERNLGMVGSVYIYYDSILYIGSFDSFTVTESDSTPHTVDYSFEFTVRAAFILDNPNPNDLGTYGVNQQAGAKPVTSAIQR